MNFEEVYAKYKAGTATDEEKVYVESEIEKAKAISDLLFEGKDKVEYNSPEKEEIRTVKKAFRTKTAITALIVTAISIVVIVGAVLGTVFGIAATAAKKEINYTSSQAEEIAIAYVLDNYAEEGDTLVVKENDRYLDMKGRLKDSRYAYSIEIICGGDLEVEVSVDAKSGTLTFEETDERD